MTASTYEHNNFGNPIPIAFISFTACSENRNGKKFVNKLIEAI